MKIGVLTYHGANNYGAVLQAYALTEWMKQNSLTPEIINYRSRVFEKYKVFRTRQYRQAPYMLGVDLFKFIEKWRRNRNFDLFRDQYLPVSDEEYLTSDALDGITEKYDCFVCGSDQIWNPELTKGIDPAYFLDFVTNPMKKISYAPSVALKSLNEFQKAKMVRYMSSFAFLSVREQETIDLLQQYCVKDITKVCDPVFLPERLCYDKICSNKYTGRKFVFLYIVGTASKYKNIINYAEKAAKYKGLQLYYLIDGDKTFCRIRGKNVYGCKPSDFLSLIRNATYIISNSFHATAFSIIFEKQFVTFMKDATGSRMSNLLRDFDLSNRIFRNTGDEDPLEQIIEYHDFESTLEQFRRNSVEFLCTALSLKPADLRETEVHTEREDACRKLFEFVEWRRKCYLARHRDQTVVADSRSGGVFTALSDVVLENGGVIYGCKMDNVDDAVHHRATTKQERDLFRGSKYIQSQMQNCYQQVKEDLRAGQSVLFSGTGCQIAGLYGFLQKEDITRLYTIDILCHGVPSIRLWQEYLKWMEKKHGIGITSVNFRDKRYGWKAHLETVTGNKKTYTTSVFRVLFLKNAFLRPSCYECPFSSLRRRSDITIGDAWGIESSKSRFNDDKGCSLLLINSDKGEQLFQQASHDFFLEEADLENFLQPNLFKPSVRPENRENAWKILNEGGFEKLKKNYGRPGLYRRLRDIMLILRKKRIIKPY